MKHSIEVTEVAAHLEQLIDEATRGIEVIITQHQVPVARLLSVLSQPRPTRGKVGELRGAPFHVPDSAFAPLTDSELEEWGL